MRIFQILDSHENTLRGELEQIERELVESSAQHSTLADEIQHEGQETGLPKMQAMETLDRFIKTQKRSRKNIERSLEELEDIRSELQQLEFQERITVAELHAESLRQRRESINQDLLPEIEQRMQRMIEERKEIDSKLLNLNEEISLLRRRSQGVIEKGR